MSPPCQRTTWSCFRISTDIQTDASLTGPPSGTVFLHICCLLGLLLKTRVDGKHVPHTTGNSSRHNYLFQATKLLNVSGVLKYLLRYFSTKTRKNSDYR